MKKIIILTMFLMTLLILTSCTTTNNLNEPCSEFEGDKKDKCFYDLAIETENSLVGICDKISEEELRDDCVFDLIGVKSRVYSCNMFSSERNRNICYYAFGDNFKKPKLCLAITDSVMRDNCLKVNVEYSVLSREMCNEIESDDIKTECLNLFEE